MSCNKVDYGVIEVNTATLVETVSGGAAGSKLGRRESASAMKLSSCLILDGEVILRKE